MDQLPDFIIYKATVDIPDGLRDGLGNPPDTVIMAAIWDTMLGRTKWCVISEEEYKRKLAFAKKLRRLKA